ncbi:MAG: Crp/Fnr family transcriptional regulator [Leptospira sp.]|nr:Crp/Fnr family transcriptional regulator [Leptospira sp.]
MELSKLLEVTKNASKSVEFPAKSVLISPNTKERVFFFVVSGQLQQYYKIKGKNHVIRLIDEGDFCESIRLLKFGKNAFEYIETVSKVSVIQFDYFFLRNLIEINTEISNFFREIIENYMLEQETRVINLISLSPKERYQNFIQSSHEKIGLFPDKILASYLGITKETMSRFRNKKLI